MNETTAQAEVATPTLAFHAVVMALTTTVKQGTKNVRVHDKFLPYSLPTLDMVDASLPAPDKWVTTKVTVEGEEPVEVSTPEYDDQNLDFVQSALTQRIQGLARSRDKAGQTPAQTWEELAESGGTKYPVQLKQFRADFLAFLLSEDGGATERQADALLSYTDAKAMMALPHARKEKVAEWINKFLEFYGDKQAEVGSVLGAIKRAMATDLDDIEL